MKTPKNKLNRKQEALSIGCDTMLPPDTERGNSFDSRERYLKTRVRSRSTKKSKSVA